MAQPSANPVYSTSMSLDDVIFIIELIVTMCDKDKEAMRSCWYRYCYRQCV